MRGWTNIKRIKGSSLIENVVALMLITLVLGMAFMIFERYISAEKTPVEWKAQLLADEWMVETVREEDFEADEKKADEFILERHVEPSGSSGKLLLLEIKVQGPEGEYVHQLKRLVHAEEK